MLWPACQRGCALRAAASVSTRKQRSVGGGRLAAQGYRVPLWRTRGIRRRARLVPVARPVNPEDCLIVMTNLPDRETADRIAQHLVESRLAACANILASCHSVYRWQGRVETADEIPLILKTTRATYPALESALRAAHPYDVPEILAVPAAGGLTAYLDWVAAETRGAE